MASNKKKRLEAIADHLALQASQEPQDEFIMDLVSTPEGIVVNTNEAVGKVIKRMVKFNVFWLR